MEYKGVKENFKFKAKRLHGEQELVFGDLIRTISDKGLQHKYFISDHGFGYPTLGDTIAESCYEVDEDTIEILGLEELERQRDEAVKMMDKMIDVIYKRLDSGSYTTEESEITQEAMKLFKAVESTTNKD